ncbi:MAG TPA: hypothetical protein VHG31_02810, partial [Stellaceae bacterium]|nr:hypothetical protein [Stellaceae bacterium]
LGAIRTRADARRPGKKRRAAGWGKNFPGVWPFRSRREAPHKPGLNERRVGGARRFWIAAAATSAASLSCGGILRRR